MDVILFGFSFLFSFILFILGEVNESAPLGLMGSISLMIMSLLLITTQLQATDLVVTNYTNTTNTYAPKTYSFASESTGATGWLMFLFSWVLVFYSMRAYLFGSKDGY
jgi:hypothetical protein